MAALNRPATSAHPGRASRPDPRRAAALRRVRAVDRRTFWLGVSAAALACALGLFHAWTRVAVLQRSYRLGGAQTEGKRMEAELQRLKLELAALENTDRVDREARQRLALAPPPPERRVVLRASSPLRKKSPESPPEETFGAGALLPHASIGSASIGTR